MRNQSAANSSSAVATPPAIRQALFRANGKDGGHYSFVILADERCAITRDDKIVHIWNSDMIELDQAVEQFLKLMARPMTLAAQEHANAN